MTPPQSDVQAPVSSPAPDAPRTRTSRDVLALFSYLWAASVLFHVASHDGWSEWRFEVVAALCVLARPTSVLALGVLAALQIAATFPLTPATQNHAVFASFVCLTLLASAGVLAVRRRGLAFDRTEWVETFAPPIRWSVIALYFFVVFHKLNTDWFDPLVSCGTEFYARQREVFPFLPISEASSRAGIYASLAIEAIIPILLVGRRTRHAGVLTAVMFHWMLGLNTMRGFFNFSSMLFAVFVLFVSEERITEAADRVGRRRLRLWSLVLACVFASYPVAEAFGVLDLMPASRLAGRFAWLGYGTGLMVLLMALVVGRRPRRDDAPPFFAMRQPVLAVIPAVVLLNGLAPHLGLHTTANWAMFSNLRTESGRSNHLLVPASWQLFRFQRDVVRVVRSSDPYLRSAANRLIPYFEIRRRPEASITYVRGGTRRVFERAADDPDFIGPLPPVARSLMVFRPIGRLAKQSCVH